MLVGQENMFETSNDILNIVKAISIFSLALLASWALFYFARILQELFRIVRETRERFNKIDEIIKSIKEKIEHSTSYLLLMSEGIKKLVEIIGKYTKHNSSREDSKKDTEENKEIE